MFGVLRKEKEEARFLDESRRPGLTSILADDEWSKALTSKSIHQAKNVGGITTGTFFSRQTPAARKLEAGEGRHCSERRVKGASKKKLPRIPDCSTGPRE